MHGRSWASLTHHFALSSLIGVAASADCSFTKPWGLGIILVCQEQTGAALQRFVEPFPTNGFSKVPATTSPELRHLPPSNNLALPACVKSSPNSGPMTLEYDSPLTSPVRDDERPELASGTCSTLSSQVLEPSALPR